MKELLKIAKAAQKVVDVHYSDLQGNKVTGLDRVIPAIQDDVKALDEKS
ncbi:MAG: hypothetical protein IKN49_04585 [Elusimicrobiaceae bacterium]|nr:hypothetical protein [Candidatus Saccharibacteria bacterium]MBR3204233.1 hypothetical protein [Candidatus Saccharibacteria bacterium]MBR3632313.1 hypothetical protein [Elusimicrobiaceae bacterium]